MLKLVNLMMHPSSHIISFKINSLLQEKEIQPISGKIHYKLLKHRYVLIFL